MGVAWALDFEIRTPFSMIVRNMGLSIPAAMIWVQRGADVFMIRPNSGPSRPEVQLSRLSQTTSGSTSSTATGCPARSKASGDSAVTTSALGATAASLSPSRSRAALVIRICIASPQLEFQFQGRRQGLGALGRLFAQQHILPAVGGGEHQPLALQGQAGFLQQ